MELKYIINSNKTIKEIIKQDLSISERLYKKIKENRIFINGSKLNFKTSINQGDILTIDLNFIEDNSNIVPNRDIKLDILYEDEWLLIVDKPAGIPVHPSLNHYTDSLSNAVKYYYDKSNIQKLIRPINRLDTGTSGIVIFAKSEYIQENIRQYIKEYLAIITGHFEGSGTINKPIARKKASIIERCISNEGQEAITHYEVLKNFNIIDNNVTQEVTLVKCRLETGRTHQIRVHFASLRHSLLGDTLYGTPSSLYQSQALNAYHIIFTHPVTHKEIEIYSNKKIEQ